jgi:hypothetical protein
MVTLVSPRRTERLRVLTSDGVTLYAVALTAMFLQARRGRARRSGLIAVIRRVAGCTRCVDDPENHSMS